MNLKHRDYNIFLLPHYLYSYVIDIANYSMPYYIN